MQKTKKKEGANLKKISKELKEKNYVNWQVDKPVPQGFAENNGHFLFEGPD